MKKLFAVVVVLAVAGCGTTDARRGHWSPKAAPRDENWHSPAAALLRYDANHDGILTKTELLTGLKAEFDAYDVKHDNCLGPDQVRAINQMRVQQDASQASPLVDWNQDGCIDFNEYSGAALSLFDSLDVNGDGKLTAQELNGARPARPDGQGPSARGHGHRGGGGTPDGQ
jgi:hypothetical protein